MSYDDWKTTEPDSCDPGRRHPRTPQFRCPVCDWHGKGYIARASHHRATGHYSFDAGHPMFLTHPTQKRRTA